MKPASLITLCAAVWVFMACSKTVDPANGSGNTSATDANPDWTTASHGKDADPDYTVVFPQTQVNTLEITMTADDWTAIRTDMKKITGSDFGAASGTPGGGGGAFSTTEPAYVAVTLKFNGKTWNKAGFRLKGNSSLSSTWRSGIYKLPFRLNMDEFEDTYTEIKDQRFYGFQELSMSPGFKDNSLIREKAGADIFRMAGIPAAQTAFYKVYIDFGAGKKYCGVYTMVEVVDDTMVKKQFGEDKGNIYKPESTFATFVQSQFEKKNNKTEADYSDAQSFITALNAANRTTNAAGWRANLEKTVNVDHYLRYLAVNNTIVNWDAYGAMAHNHYFYNMPSKGLTWIPWDLNESMTSSSGAGKAVSLEMTEVAKTWPLIRYVADDPVYYAKYKQYVKEFNDTVFTPAKMNTLFEQYTTLITPYVNGTEKEQAPYSHLTSLTNFTGALATLKQHVTTRNQAVANFVK
nr:CotH kinase family protein [uncultured Arsenicibacter sp.]